MSCLSFRYFPNCVFLLVKYLFLDLFEVLKDLGGHEQEVLDEQTDDPVQKKSRRSFKIDHVSLSRHWAKSLLRGFNSPLCTVIRKSLPRRTESWTGIEYFLSFR